MQVRLETAGGQCNDCPYMYKSAGISCCNVYNDLCQKVSERCYPHLYGEYMPNWRDDCKGCRWCDARGRAYCRLFQCDLLKYPKGLILKCKACAEGTKRDYSAVQLVIGLILIGVALWT